MPGVFLITPGASARLESERMIVEIPDVEDRDRKVVQHMPLRDVDRVILTENIGFTANRRLANEIKGHPCGANEMLVIVAYDITDSKRLSRVAKFCLDFGLRVQYSMFECQLPQAEFDRLWKGLKDLIDPENDRIVAYRVCASCAKEVLKAGTMVRPDGEVLAYVF